MSWSLKQTKNPNNGSYSSNAFPFNILGQTEDVLMLLSFGVDPTIPDARSRYVIDILKKNKNFNAVKAVRDHTEKHTSSSVELEGTAWILYFSCF